MKLIGRVILLALCILSVYSLPSAINTLSGKESIGNIRNGIKTVLHNHFDSSNQTNSNNTNSNDTNSNSTTPDLVDACYAKYIIQQGILDKRTIHRTKACYQINNQSSIANNQTVNATLTDLRNSSYDLQARLELCSQFNSSVYIFYCNSESFDRNLEDLSDIQELSALGLDNLSGNYTDVENAQRACVSSVITASKVKSIRALSELESCVYHLGHLV